MYYIHPDPNPGGGFPAPQSIAAPGLLAFPEEFLPVFYPENKKAAGFVLIQHDGETVTSCQWNEDAYQAYLAELPAGRPAGSPGYTGYIRRARVCRRS